MLAEQGGPVPLSEVAAALGGHPNTTRGHLEALRKAGLVRRVAGRSSVRGRPPWLHALTELGRSAARRAASGQGGWELTEQMAMAFVRHLAAAPDPVGPSLEVGRRWGASVGRVTRARTRGGRRRALVDILDRMGFTPAARGALTAPTAPAAPAAPTGATSPSSARHRAGATDEIVLLSCPLLKSATEHPEVVCTVHRGLVEGMLRQSRPTGDGGPADSDVQVELEPWGRPEGCRLLLTWGVSPGVALG